MTEPVAAWRLTYTPGTWLVLAGPSTLVVMLPAPARASALVQTLWADIVRAGSADALLKLVGEVGLAEMPDFGAFFWDEAGLHGLARGRVRLVDAESGDVALEGEGSVTWNEARLGTERRLRIDLEPVDENEVLQLPLVVGSATVSAIYLSTNSADLVRFPTAESAGLPAAAVPSAVDESDAGDDPAVEAPAAREPGADAPEQAADDQPDEDQAAEEPPAEEQLAVDQPAGDPSAEDQPADEPPADEQPAEEPAAEAVVTDAPAPQPEPEEVERAEVQPEQEAEPSAAVPEPWNGSDAGQGEADPGDQPTHPEQAPDADPAPEPEHQPTAEGRGVDDPHPVPEGFPNIDLNDAGPDAEAPPHGAPVGAPPPFGASSPVPPPVPGVPPTPGIPAAPPLVGQPHSLSSPEPQRAAPVVIPPKFGDIDDDTGGTIFSTGLAATHKPAAREERPDAQVLAVPCTNGHANAPGTRSCRLCQAPVDSANPRLIRRPTLAGVHTNQGDFADIVSGIVIGRAPDASFGPAGSHLMRVPSPSNDISRNHVLVTVKDWNVHVTDLHSTNGTTVLPIGEPPFMLRDGASVQVELGTVLDLGDGVSIRVEPPRG